MDKQFTVFRQIMYFPLSLLILFAFSSSAFANPSYNLESCSKIIGTTSENCYQDDSANGWADTANGPMNGWASSDIQGWHGAEKAAYRFDKIQILNPEME